MHIRTQSTALAISPFSNMGDTWCTKAAAHVRRQTGCPLVLKGTVTKMTREGFKTACLKIQKKHTSGAYDDGKYGEEGSCCTNCTTGEQVKNGGNWRAPKWIKFLSLQKLQDEK